MAAAMLTPKRTCSQSGATGTAPADTWAAQRTAAISARDAVCAPTTPAVTTDKTFPRASAKTTARAARTRRGSVGSTTLPSP